MDLNWSAMFCNVITMQEIWVVNSRFLHENCDLTVISASWTAETCIFKTICVFYNVLKNQPLHEFVFANEIVFFSLWSFVGFVFLNFLWIHCLCLVWPLYFNVFAHFFFELLFIICLEKWCVEPVISLSWWFCCLELW